MAKRVDANQTEIVEALRAVGWSVAILAPLGRGVPDLLAGGIHRRTGRPTNLLIEVKSETGRLTADEAKWMTTWRGQAAIVRGVDDALRLVGVIE